MVCASSHLCRREECINRKITADQNIFCHRGHRDLRGIIIKSL
jgi:hypothetical protein